jgi:cyclic pyranopterin phosphate synthase
LRSVKVLRISVTDRCDLRCVYCMPEEGVPLVPMSDLLTYEEIAAVARAALAAGVRRFRLTGGEPLARRGVASLVRLLAALGPDDLALTTNGLGLAGHASELKASGLGRVTVSLDTLRPDRFERIARRRGLDRILAGIAAARAAGLGPIKINTVVIRGLNDDEVPDFVRFARDERLEVRFIELMPTSGLGPECKELGGWRPALLVKGGEVRARIEAAFGPLVAAPGGGGEAGVARTYLLDGATRIGLITPLSEPFCRGCERLRLGPDGRLRVCLFDRAGIDLRRALREDRAGPAELEALVRAAFAAKATWERGALETLSSDMFRIGG